MLTNVLTGEEITLEQLNPISQMVANQAKLEREIALKQEELQTMSDRLKTLSEQLIPEAMLAIGLSELKLASGESVTIKKYYSASIPADKLFEAIAWLRKTGNDDIIKNTVSLQFGKGEDERANKLAEDLRKQGLTPEQKIFVHPMTLKSFVKERIESAQELPLDMFGVYVGNKTVIKQPK